MAYHTRHYYDVHRLLETRAVLQSLQAQPDLVTRYAADAYAESLAAKRPATFRPAEGFAASPAFTDRAVLAAAREDYLAEMTRLSLGATPEFDEVIATIENAAAYL